MSTAAVWGVLLTVLLVAWVVLDGAVQGVGATLLRERGKDGSDRRRAPARRSTVLAAVGPLRLPGEASLVAAALVLVLAFPQAASDLMRVAYPLVVALAGSCVVRDAVLWLRGRRPGQVWHDVWEAVLVVASIVLAGSWGALLGVAWGNGLAALGLAVVAVVVTRLHGDAVVVWRLRRTTPLPVIVTAVMIAAPVVGTAVAAWSRFGGG
ncbi:cytochrome d ubiquinol oxidase subunit II [Promicromonospora sp. MS192]|uniref:cytochrome d ubiquinol oxidase subunit II n=1 Tax=Promicromonospora sp. MS192 TaxID=3412684 RepID=UPI003C2E26D9